MALTGDQVSQIYVDLNQALAAYMAAYQAGNSNGIKLALDRVNRDELLVGAAPQYLYPGYTLPNTFDDVPPLPGIPNPTPGTTAPPAGPAVQSTGVQISISPFSGTLFPGQSLQFTATVSNAFDFGVTWSVFPSAGLCTIDQHGLLTALVTNANQIQVTVTATAWADASKSVQATVVLMPALPTTTTTPPPTTTTPPPTTTTPRPTTTPPPTTTAPPPPATTTTPRPTPTQPPPLPRVSSGSPRLASEDDCFDNPAAYCCLFPSDPVCGGSGFPPGFPFPFPGGGGGGGPVTIIEGISEATVWSDIWGALTGLWTIIVGAVDAAILAAIKAIQAAVTAIAQALAAAFHTLARLAGLILKFLQTVMSKILHALVRAVQEIGRRLDQLYRKVFIPILQALGAIRKRLLQIYAKYIRPAMIILQRIRTILAILRAFHVKWAAKLDATLADLERRVLAPFFQLLGYVNMLANLMNLIMTARYILQKPIWMNTLYAYRGSTINAQINGMNGTPSPSDLAAIAAGSQLATTQQTAADMRNYFDTGSGNVTPLIAAANTAFQQTTQQG